MSDPGQTDASTGRENRPQYGGGEISFWEILAFLIRGRVVAVSFAFLFSGVVMGLGLLEERTWTSSASFRPQSARASGTQFSAIAAQFGVSLGQSGDGETPAFYAEVLRSKTLLSRIASQPYAISGDPSRDTTLAALLEVTTDDEHRAESSVVRWLRESAISVAVGRETGLVQVDVTTQWPHLSLQLASALLDEINRFNNQSRRSRATVEKAFIETQLDTARTELMQAEAEYREFLEANRRLENSAELQFENDRLAREVNLQQQLYTELRQAYQQARISEVRNTPVINTLEQPRLPVLPDGRGLASRMILAFLLGGGFGLVITFFRRSPEPEASAEKAAYREVKRFVSDLRQGDWRRVLFQRGNRPT